MVRTAVTVGAAAERAFHVFTQRCDEWWPRSYRLGKTERVGVVLEPHTGGRWYERTADGEDCDWGQVLAWDPPEHLTLSWQIGIGFVPESDPQRASRVDITFVETGPARTTVTVVHSEFERHGEGWESMREGVSNTVGGRVFFRPTRSSSPSHPAPSTGNGADGRSEGPAPVCQQVPITF
jgi:hypothetical protein